MHECPLWKNDAQRIEEPAVPAAWWLCHASRSACTSSRCAYSQFWKWAKPVSAVE